MWIVIECAWGAESACICMNEEDGSNMLFDSEDDAKKYAADECQEGMALEI